MNVEQYLIAKLADVMFAVGETKTERTAIGCVVRNRALDLTSWHDAIETLKAHRREKNPHSPDFLSCLWAAEEIFYNRTPDMTQGATAFTQEPLTGAVSVGKWFFTNKEARSEIITAELVETDELEVFERGYLL